MLQAAMEILRRYWPDASLEIITDDQYLTKLYYPDARPVSPYNLHKIHGRLDKMHRFVHRNMSLVLIELRETLLHRQMMSF